MPTFALETSTAGDLYDGTDVNSFTISDGTNSTTATLS